MFVCVVTNRGMILINVYSTVFVQHMLRVPRPKCFFTSNPRSNLHLYHRFGTCPSQASSLFFLSLRYLSRMQHLARPHVGKNENATSAYETNNTMPPSRETRKPGVWEARKRPKRKEQERRRHEGQEMSLIKPACLVFFLSLDIPLAHD